MALIQFSDTTNMDGIVELLSRATHQNSATSSSYPLKQKTKDINSALDNFLMIARKASPTIKIDDTNFTGEPLYSQNLTSGTQGYTFTVDSSSAQIQSIDRVDIETSSGTIKRLKQLNPENVGATLDDTTGLGQYKITSGEPTEYRIVGKNIYLYPKPNYTTSSGTGLRLYNERAPSYFVSTDTTKTPGINQIFHDYLWLRPAYLYCAIKRLPQKDDLKVELEKMEAQIADYFARHNKDATRMDQTQRIKPKTENTR